MTRKNDSSLPTEQASPHYFTGYAALKRWVKDSDVRVNIVNVTFEPKARTFWHTHPLGQVLIVTEGKGYFQKRGEAVQLLQPGDIITISPNEEHWHGATESSTLTHIAMNPNPETGSDTAWLEEVPENIYNSYKE